VRRTASFVAALLVALPLAGCERVMHNMYDQPKRGPGAASPLFADGRATRPPPEGSVAHSHGRIAAISSGRAGAQSVAAAASAAARQALPHPVSRAMLLRGQQRYTIYCLPCHSALGDGQGPVVRHGFPAPPSYHIERLREAADRYLYDVITHGHGVMYSYADRIKPTDRWAIVAYIRALQLSQHATVEQLPPELLAALPVAPAASAARPPSAAASGGRR
jgi:mono/diheme cytochrome c family protein